MIYADWLESQGVALGEWAALQRAIAVAPGDIELRIAALVYLQQHARDVLGAAASILDGLYLGWHGGFLDEIRLHGTDGMEGDAALRLAALLRHPVARFVRTITLGTFTQDQLGDDSVVALLDVLAEHAPPLL